MNLTVYLFIMFWKSSVNSLISLTGMRLAEFTIKTLKIIYLFVYLLFYFIFINKQAYFQMSVVLFLAFYTHKCFCINFIWMPWQITSHSVVTINRDFLIMFLYMIWLQGFISLEPSIHRTMVFIAVSRKELTGLIHLLGSFPYCDSICQM